MRETRYDAILVSRYRRGKLCIPRSWCLHGARGPRFLVRRRSPRTWLAREPPRRCKIGVKRACVEAIQVDCLRNLNSHSAEVVAYCGRIQPADYFGSTEELLRKLPDAGHLEVFNKDPHQGRVQQTPRCPITTPPCQDPFDSLRFRHSHRNSLENTTRSRAASYSVAVRPKRDAQSETRLYKRVLCTRACP